jgi:Family of unknown function (DUF6496)
MGAPAHSRLTDAAVEAPLGRQQRQSRARSHPPQALLLPDPPIYKHPKIRIGTDRDGKAAGRLHGMRLEYFRWRAPSKRRIMAATKKPKRRYGKAAGKAVKSAVKRAKSGTLKSGKGKHPKVKSRKQAIAIGLSEARRKGAKVPRKKKAT